MLNPAPIVVYQVFEVPAFKLWAAITEEDQMRQWFFENMESFRPEIGFYTEFDVKTPERNFLHQWKIIDVLDGQRIVYDWRYKHYQGKGFVTFQVNKITESRSSLHLISLITNPFPQDIPEFERESGVNGWKYFINQRLDEYLK